jgi:hypothetical protein
MRKIYNIKSNTNEETYSVVLTFDDSGKIDPIKTSCDCKHGSFYRYTQKNMAAGRWKCKHINEAIKLHEKNVPDEILKGGENGEKRREIEPIFQ